VVAAYIHKVTDKIGVLVELQETCKRSAPDACAQTSPCTSRRASLRSSTAAAVPAERVEHERVVLAELTRNEGKPEAAIPKIVEGRLGKFYEGFCLVDQPVRAGAIEEGRAASGRGEGHRAAVRALRSRAGVASGAPVGIAFWSRSPAERLPETATSDSTVTPSQRSRRRSPTHMPRAWTSRW